MYYVLLVSEDICKDVQSERLNVDIKSICESKDEAKYILGQLYGRLQQEETFNVSEYKDNSFHLENLDIDKCSYTGTIIEFPQIKSTGIV